MANQTTNVRAAAAVSYPTYNVAMYGAHPNAWAPRSLANTSVYGNPGYAAVAGRIGMAAAPVAYDYGSNVVAMPNEVYINGDPVGTPQEYGIQASQLASHGLDDASSLQSEAEWLPLGLFSVVVGDQTSSDDTFQLAYNPQGGIRGNYHNVPSDNMETIFGSVDKTTQRACWTIGSDQYPVYEAGIYNLMKDSAPVLVHTGDGQPPKQITLIRIPSPEN